MLNTHNTKSAADWGSTLEHIPPPGVAALIQHGSVLRACAWRSFTGSGQHGKNSRCPESGKITLCGGFCCPCHTTQRDIYSCCEQEGRYDHHDFRHLGIL